MKRRDFIRKTGKSVALAMGASVFASARVLGSKNIPTVLRGGKCWYKDKWQILDIGISNEGKLIIGENDSLSGDNIIMVTDRIVSSGFIDILADNSTNPKTTYPIFEKYKLSDGVTTALQMHGGSSDAGRYYREFESLPHRINFGVSTAVMFISYKTKDINQKKKLIEKCLDEGALGISHSLEYMPLPYNEVLEYAKLAKLYDRTFFLHLRYSSPEKELLGIDEAIALSKDSGARVHIDHIHSTGGTYNMALALSKIKDAISAGQQITCCVYPYSNWATYLNSKRFDPGWQQRFGLTFNDLQIVGTDKRISAENFEYYRNARKLVAVPEGTMSFENTIDLALKEDFCMVGSDGGIQFEPRANSHPRGAGCFATFIRHGIEMGLNMEKIIEKISYLPRTLILPAMKNRGLILEGMIADLTIFDPVTIDAMATVENPNQYSEGIDWVFVNGNLAYHDRKFESFAGKPIKYNS